MSFMSWKYVNVEINLEQVLCLHVFLMFLKRYNWPTVKEMCPCSVFPTENNGHIFVLSNSILFPGSFDVRQFARVKDLASCNN